MDELAAAFRHASVKYFWPAMVRGDLEVHVETPSGEHTEATFDDAPGVKPFVECYRELFNVTEEELSGAGSIAKREVDISIPREDPDTVEDDPHDGYETALDLVVRQLSPADRGNLDDNTNNGDLEINHVARLRGAQMVVNYIDMSPAANRGKDFAAVLVGGEAQADPGADASEEQAALEEFLKRPEPTQHDDWVGSNNDFLDEHYIGTITAEINALKGERLQDELTDVVEEDVNAGDEVPGMDNVAPIMDGKSTEDGESSALEWETRPEVWLDDDKWQFFARGGPNIDDHGDWTLTIELVRLDSQEHEGDLIPIDEFDIVGGSAEETRIDGDGVTHVELNAATDQIAFEGDSRELDGLSRDPATLFEVGEATQTKIKVSAEITEESST